MRTENICSDMPKRVPLTLGALIMNTLLVVSVIGMIILPYVRAWQCQAAYRRLRLVWEPIVRRRVEFFIGAQAEYIDLNTIFFDEGFRCTGLAYGSGKVYVIDHGTIAEFTWDEIRRWSWEVAEPNQIALIRGNNSDRLQAFIQNSREARKTALSNGFKVHVADVRQPEWKFTTSDEKVCNRWYEIFNQLNEGQLLAA